MKYIVSLAFVIISCTESNYNLDSRSVKLNAEAIEKINESDYESALNFLNKALQSDSLNYSAYRNKTIVLTRMGRNNDAIQTNKIWITKNPNSVDGYFFLGSNFSSIGDSINTILSFKKAIQLLQEKISQNEMVFENEIRLAICYKFIGEEEKAQNLFNKYLPQEKEKYLAIFNSLYKPGK